MSLMSDAVVAKLSVWEALKRDARLELAYHEKRLPFMVGALAFLYFFLLSAKQFTWIFVSGDSGDWLAASKMWIAPQPYGNPLFVTFGHLINTIMPQNLVVGMTVFGSCLASAVTVAAVYMIVVRLTKSLSAAFVAALILTGSAIFLSQSTVLSQYPLAVMFPTLALLFYVEDRRKLAVLMLGLGAATHIVVIVLAFLWFVAELYYGRWREWAKLIPLFVVVGLLPYALTLWELNRASPQLLAGGPLSLQSISNYLGSTGVVGTLAVLQFPVRAFQFTGFIVVSMGVALIPMFVGLKQKDVKGIALIWLTLMFVCWYYLTCIDPTTWHYLPWIMPFLAILAGIGVTRIAWKPAMKWVSVGAGCLIAANAVWLNAGVESQQNNKAERYLQDMMDLPDGSALVINRGGYEGLAFDYAFASRKKLVPIYLLLEDHQDSPLYLNYNDWMRKEYGVEAVGTKAMIAEEQQKGVPVYVMRELVPGWQLAIEQEAYNQNFGKVVGVNWNVPVTSKISYQEVK